MSAVYYYGVPFFPTYSLSIVRQKNGETFDCQIVEKTLLFIQSISQEALAALDYLAVCFSKEASNFSNFVVGVTFENRAVSLEFVDELQDLMARVGSVCMKNWSFNIQDNVHVILNISLLETTSSHFYAEKCSGALLGGGVSTGTLRFPHLIAEVCQLFQDKGSKDVKACIVGAGLMENLHTGMAVVPQVAELCALLPKAHFLALDNSSHVVQILRDQIQKGVLNYDPCSLAVWLKRPDVNRHLQESLQEMSRSMVNNAEDKDLAEKMLSGESDKTHIGIKAAQLVVRQFDILTSAFEEGECFDFMVATYSISNALREAHLTLQDRTLKGLEILAKFLKKLKTNGVLYLDANINMVFNGASLLALSYLEMLVGHKLSCQTVELEDNNSSKLATDVYLRDPVVGFPNHTISTSDIVAFTKDEALELSSADKVSLEDKMQEWLAKT